MKLGVRRLLQCSTGVLSQFRLFGRSSRLKEYPYLVKAVQGMSKDPQGLSLPRINRVNRFGEDSWFVSSTPKAEVMGVADGVGGWRKLGIDAGIFAKELMNWCSNNAQHVDFDGRNPRQLLIDSYNQMKLRSRDVLGSSTACLVALKRSDCTLHTANLGDSGFLVVRGGKLLLRSDEQSHGFNTPYQLAMLPKEQENKSHCDTPEQAVTTHLALEPGDVVLVATDGLFDNVPDNMLVRQLATVHGETQKEKLQLVANNLVALASDLSNSSNFQSPFARKARANNIYYDNGGKPDDITLILASVALQHQL